MGTEERYLGSFPQKLGQSDNIRFKLSLVSPLTSYLQPWIIRSFWDEGPAVPVIRLDAIIQFCHLEYPQNKIIYHKKMPQSSWGTDSWSAYCPSLLLTFGTEAGSQEAEPGPGPGACRLTGRGWATADCCRRWRSHFHQNRSSPAQPQKALKSCQQRGKELSIYFVLFICSNNLVGVSTDLPWHVFICCQLLLHQKKDLNL